MKDAGSCMWWESNVCFYIRPAYVKLCKVQSAYLTISIRCIRNARKIQQGRRWGHTYRVNEEWNCSLWIVSRLVWFYIYVQVPNYACKFHEEDLMGENQTVFRLWTDKSFSLGKWKPPMWSGGANWVWWKVLEPWPLQSWCDPDIWRFIPRVDSAWCSECVFAWVILWILVGF